MAFMATDDKVRRTERRSLVVLAAFGATFSIIGIWNFEIHQLLNVPFTDWMLMGFFPIFILYLTTRRRLVKAQSKSLERECSIFELSIKDIPDKGLVMRYHVINKVMWGYAVIALVALIFGGRDVSI